VDETTDLGDPSVVPPLMAATPFPDEEPALIDQDEDSDIEAQRAQIEQTRSAMGETIDAIEHRLSPHGLAQQAKETVRGATIGKVENALNTATDTVQQAASSAEETAAAAGGTIFETIKRNPVPAALAGIGLGWLIMEARKSDSGAGASGPYSSSRNRGYAPYRSPYGYSQYGTPTDRMYGGGDQSNSQTGQVMGQVQQTAGQVVNQAQDAAGQVVDQAQQVTGQVMDQAQQMTGQVATQVQQQAQTASSTFSRMLQEQPLAVGAGALAVGLAVGLAIPETPQEAQLMGPARETVMQKVGEAAQQAGQKVEQAVEGAISGENQSG